MVVCTIGPRFPHVGRRRCLYPVMLTSAPVRGSNPLDYPRPDECGV
jgi:hypothetical protein